MSDRKKKKVDAGLDAFLDLDGEVFFMDKGCWTKIEAKRVDPSRNIPHGIKYSLTLHDKNNNRVIGYDNAHATGSSKKKYKADRIEWDHKHEKERVKQYEYENAAQLLKDFFNDVDKYIENL